MSPRDSVHPRVGLDIALKVHVNAFLDSAAVDVAAELQVNDRYVCGQKEFTL
jgi:hypothetical protein